MRGATADPNNPSRQSETAEVEQVLIAGYWYDPFNRRIVRVVPGSEIDARYSYDGWHEIEEFEPETVGASTTARPVKAQIWDNASFSQLLSFHSRDDLTGQWSSYFAIRDEQGSATRLLDSSGNEMERYEYDPFGTRRVYEPNGSGSYTLQAVSALGCESGYTGHRHDPETGLVYARNRYLHSGWGRFLTVDPIGGWEDWGNLGNPYAFTENRPTSASDPRGLHSVASGAGGGSGDTGPGSSGTNGGFDGGLLPPGRGDAGGGGGAPGGSTPRMGMGCSGVPATLQGCDKWLLAIGLACGNAVEFGASVPLFSSDPEFGAAYSHCLAHCLITAMCPCGVTISILIGLGTEIAQTVGGKAGDGTLQSAMQQSDFWDNALGRNIGSPVLYNPKDCAADCQAAMGGKKHHLEGPGEKRPYGPFHKTPGPAPTWKDIIGATGWK